MDITRTHLKGGVYLLSIILSCIFINTHAQQLSYDAENNTLLFSYHDSHQDQSGLTTLNLDDQHNPIGEDSYDNIVGNVRTAVLSPQAQFIYYLTDDNDSTLFRLNTQSLQTEEITLTHNNANASITKTNNHLYLSLIHI